MYKAAILYDVFAAGGALYKEGLDRVIADIYDIAIEQLPLLGIEDEFGDQKANKIYEYQQ